MGCQNQAFPGFDSIQVDETLRQRIQPPVPHSQPMSFSFFFSGLFCLSFCPLLFFLLEKRTNLKKCLRWFLGRDHTPPPPLPPFKGLAPFLPLCPSRARTRISAAQPSFQNSVSLASTQEHMLVSDASSLVILFYFYFIFCLMLFVTMDMLYVSSHPVLGETKKNQAWGPDRLFSN
ncbi:hypothetical protein F4810DRAFT_120668 [Camillea tinctor]|nr:hypothetical protein F4810DRAFT_120668 [Camillea tinctor]